MATPAPTCLSCRQPWSSSRIQTGTPLRSLCWNTQHQLDVRTIDSYFTWWHLSTKGLKWSIQRGGEREKGSEEREMEVEREMGGVKRDGRGWREEAAVRENLNSNLKTLFHKYCSLGSVRERESVCFNKFVHEFIADELCASKRMWMFCEGV